MQSQRKAQLQERLCPPGTFNKAFEGRNESTIYQLRDNLVLESSLRIVSDANNHDNEFKQQAEHRKSYTKVISTFGKPQNLVPPKVL